MPIQLLPRSCLETQVFEGETLTILDTVEKVINALGMTNPTPVDADNNIADRSPAPRAVRTVMYGVVSRNPQYMSRMAEVAKLDGVLSTSMGCLSSGLGLVNVDTLDVVCTRIPSTSDRILRISNHVDADKNSSPRRGIINLAVKDPDLFAVKNGFLCSLADGSFVVASVTGVTTHFANEASSQSLICVKPFLHSWARLTAVIGKVFHSNSLFFRTREGGVSFTSSSVKTRNRATTARPGKDWAPINGPILPMHEKVPIYDGRDEFSLSNYWVKKYRGDVQPGSSVVVLFSIRQGRRPKNLRRLGSLQAVYLYVLGVIVVAEAGDPYYVKTPPNLDEALGVNEMPRLLNVEMPGYDDEDEAQIYNTGGNTAEVF